MTILDEKPREILFEKGPDSVSDYGLIAILLGTGTKNENVIELSKKIITKYGSLTGLLSTNTTELKKIKGLGKAKITKLIAVSELARRQSREKLEKINILNTPQMVFEYLKTCYMGKTKEIFKVIYLTGQNEIISEEDLFIGTVNESAIYPREIVKNAILKNASSLIFAHNHPLCSCEPSREDIAVTKKLMAACKLVDIRVVDHIIIGNNEYFSFKENKII